MTPRRLPLRRRKASTRRPGAKALWLGLASVVLARLLPRRTRAGRLGDLRRHDYRTSTQRMGVRFTERLRDVFRFRWIRRAS